MTQAAKRAEWKANGLCSGCGKVPPAGGMVRCQTCIEKKRNTPYNVARFGAKEAAIKQYGGGCSCCGETIPQFLELHHKHGGGGIDRAKGFRNTAEWAMRNGWPDTLELQCANCHQGAHRNGGICPHKTKGE